MASKLKVSPFGDRSRSKYPWEQWLDGSPWAITPGDDFYVGTRTFAAAAYSAGKRLNKSVRLTEKDGKVILQAFDKE